MLLSYAQRLEDYHLALAFAGQTDGVYIDVGAGHPVADNVSYWFYLRGWSGLVVEPQENLLALYGPLRPRDRRVGTLVGREIGETDFHIVDRLHGLSTTVPANARMAEGYGVRTRTERRAVTTLAQLCESHGIGRVDFLKIDVEGAEGEVLAGADFERWRPRVVVAEVLSPAIGADEPPPWERVLLSRDYRFILFDGLNRFYVAGEEPDLAARLPRTPAPWDAVSHLYDLGRAPENPDHPDHALAGRLVAAFLAALPDLGEERLLSLLQSSPEPLPAGDDLVRLLLGRVTEGHPPPALPDGASAQEACRAILRTDAFRAALGRIAAPFDGGLVRDG